MPRAGLTTERVVVAAAQVADEVGFERLTLAAVAERFDVALPSLYKHVDGIDALRGGVTLLAVRELGAVLARAAVGRSRGEALRSIAAAYRDYALAHPGRYAASIRAPHPDDEEHLAAAENVLHTLRAVLDGYGLASERTFVDAARAVRSALHGFVSLEVAGGFGLPRDVDRSYRWLVDALDATLAERGSAG